MTRLRKPLAAASLFNEPEEPQLAPGEKKPRKKPVMLTGRSRKYLQREGYITALVERTIDVPKFEKGKFVGRFINKFDCFGFADVVAVKPDETGTMYLQVTDHTSHSKRVEKIIEAKAAPVILKAGNSIWVHSWKSQKPRGRPKLWRLRREFAVLVSGRVEFRAVEDNLWFKEDGDDYFDPTF